MKPEDRAIISKAMSFLIMNLDVTDLLAAEIESKNILDKESIDEILVCSKQ